MTLSAADSDPGSGAFLTPGSEKGFVRIPNPYFWKFGDKDKKSTEILCNLATNFSPLFFAIAGSGIRDG